MTIKFKLRRPEQTETSLYVEFKNKGQKITIFPGKVVQTKFWTGDKCKPKHPASGEMNLFLSTWKNDLEKIILNLETQKEFICKERIEEELNRIYKLEVKETREEKDFIDFIDTIIKSKKDKKREVQKLEQTRKLIIVGFNLITKKHLAEWERLGIRKKSQTILKTDFKLKFDTINLKFIEDFRDFLYKAKFTIKIDGDEVTQNYKINYIDKQVKGLKQFISAAIEAKLVERFTWTSIRAENREVDSVYTDFDEIQAMYDKEFINPTAILVRDKYVINCFLGLRYSDLNKIESHLFSKKTIQGKEFVVYTGRAQKTDQKVEFALHPIASSILEKYNYQLPKLSIKVFNEVIKTVAEDAGLKKLERVREIRGNETIINDLPKYKLMSSHAGRRSFCTNFYVEGVSIAAIMSISGHSTEKEFRKYIKKASVRLDIVAEQVFAIKGLNTSLKVA